MTWPSRDEIVFAGNYQSYESMSNTIDSDKITVLNFYAPRCPSCRAAHTNILNQVDQLPANVQILNVDYDTNANLRQKYGVTSQHTFVLIDRNGNAIRSIKWLNHVSEILDFVWDEMWNREPIVADVVEDGDTESWTNALIEENNTGEAPIATVVPDQQGNTTTTSEPKQEEIKEEVRQSAGIYTDYESGKRYISDTNKNVVLFFHASRCPNCRQAEQNIIANRNSIDSNLVILKVDYDAATDLKKQYGITSQTSYVLVNTDGSLNKKAQGLTSLQAIEKFVQ